MTMENERGVSTKAVDIPYGVNDDGSAWAGTKHWMGHHDQEAPQTGAISFHVLEVLPKEEDTGAAKQPVEHMGGRVGLLEKDDGEKVFFSPYDEDASVPPGMIALGGAYANTEAFITKAVEERLVW